MKIASVSETLKGLAKNPAVGGAVLGGGLGAGTNIRKEMATRHGEDYHPDQELVAKNRKKRIGRMAASTAASAGTGALLGHFGGKGVRALKNTAKNAIKNVGDEVKGVVSHTGGEIKGTTSHIADDVKTTSSHLTDRAKDVGDVIKDVNTGVGRRLLARPKEKGPSVFERIKSVWNGKKKETT
jgi:hypothetical protein